MTAEQLRPPPSDALFTEYQASRSQTSLFDPQGTSFTAHPYDELIDAEGRVRASWQPIAQSVADYGEVGVRNLRARVARLIDDDGITYNDVRHADDGHPISPSPWRLDPLPLLVDQAEWSSLSAGLVQRSTLLDLVLRDAYGPRRLLTSGAMPPEVLFGHDGYVRAAHGIENPGTYQLFLHGCDVSRWADGEFRVTEDRTQAPSGVGYAMADRRVVSRAMPEVFEHANPRPLSPFARAMRLSLRNAAPDAVDDPEVVVLSPGTHSETAFDQAYLATVLGFPLVESADLVVRDGHVWMRSLGKLRRVDVILRRVDAHFADPLDLAPESRLGVVGLVEAAKRGNVVIVNPLGSGVLENPALAHFLPQICRELLGEDLKLGSTPSFWAGEPTHRSHILANLSRLLVRSTVNGQAIDGRHLTVVERADLADRIAAETWRWIAQTPPEYSVAPALGPTNTASAKPVGLRLFSLAQSTGFVPMSGGLGYHVSPDGVHAVAKDLWVRAEERPTTHRPTVFRAPEALPTFLPPRVDVLDSPRVLNDMFWFGRYAERAESLARVLSATTDRYLDYRYRPWLDGSDSLPILLDALDAMTGSAESASAAPASSSARRLHHLTSRRDVPGTLAHAVDRLQHCARAVRDQLSTDTWPILGEADRQLSEFGADETFSDTALSATQTSILTATLALSGLTAESMVRDTAWRVMDIGKRIERALALTALLASTLVKVHAPGIEPVVAETVLIATESSVTYRRRNRAGIRIAAMAQLLLVDATNPRSLVFTLGAIRDHLSVLPGASGASRSERVIDDIVATMRRVDPTDLETVDDGGRRVSFDDLLESTHRQLRTFAEVFSAAKLSLPGEMQPIWGPEASRMVG